ncbi:MarR family winged helix-turn-helix transcriptional regulator [Bacillus sp. OTU530]|uniref:MarR family winged helix-turn-helix transcriptional regulator n=1 Tax=Bacillus sp. OTU530 TaxID=3043862 RepID=UPI00313D7F16
MSNHIKIELIDSWMSLTNLQALINNRIETALQENYNLSLKEFYVLYFLSQTSDKELRLQKLQEMVGLSQSAISRLVGRLETKSCGVLQRHICEDDRRGIYTCLTPLGEEKLQKSLATVETLLRDNLSKEMFLQELNLISKKVRS